MVEVTPITIKIDWYVVYKLRGQAFSSNPVVYVNIHKRDNNHEKEGVGRERERGEKEHKTTNKLREYSR